jgi:hypothetical protein
LRQHRKVLEVNLHGGDRVFSIYLRMGVELKHTGNTLTKSILLSQSRNFRANLCQRSHLLLNMHFTAHTHAPTHTQTPALSERTYPRAHKQTRTHGHSEKAIKSKCRSEQERGKYEGLEALFGPDQKKIYLRDRRIQAVELTLKTSRGQIGNW